MAIPADAGFGCLLNPGTKMKKRIYAGIGSRETPKEVLQDMQFIGAALAVRNATLRSGGAGGADSAFEHGCNLMKGAKEIYIPWDGFNNRENGREGAIIPPFNDQVFEYARAFHPNWAACSDGAKKLHARNLYQIGGIDLNTAVDFVVCWTKDGKASGGTGQAIRIAESLQIPVFNLFDEESRKALLLEIIKYDKP